MAIFCLILRPDGPPVQPDEVDRLLDPVAYAAPGGRRVWTDGNLGIGCLYPRRATRQHAQQPLLHPQRGLILVADCRLDARADLMQALAIPANRRSVISDEELLLAAWLRWGDDCGEHLYGDYAFVVYDQVNARLTGISDAPGARRLLYARRRDGSFLITSEEACLLAHDDLTNDWNDVALASWLMGTPERTASIFAAIGVVACGRSLTLDQRGLHVRAWWDPARTPRVHYRRRSDYAEHYCELLVQAIDDCIGPDTTAVLCELSGGMDSSSVTAATCLLARRRDLRVSSISQTFPGYASCDDAQVMADTRGALGITDYVSYDAGRMYLEQFRTQLGPRVEGPNALNLPAQFKAVEAARDRGASVILTGFGGDELTRGSLYAALAARLRRGDLGGLREIPASCRRRGLGCAEVLAQLLARPMVRALLGDRLADLLTGRSQWRAHQPFLLAEQPGLQQRWLAARRRAAAPAGRSQRLRQLLLELRFTPSWEQLDAYRLNALPHGIGAHAPLLGRSILEFALGSPADLWFGDGWTKLLVRAAFADLLPESVRAVVWKTMAGEPAAKMWQANADWISNRFARAAQCTQGALAIGFDAASARWIDAGHAATSNLHSVFLATWLILRSDRQGM